MKKVVIFPLLLLAACTTPQEREAKRVAQEQEDIAYCVDLGFEQGEPSFADCRLRLVELRAAQRNAVRSSYGIGFGGRFGGFSGRYGGFHH